MIYIYKIKLMKENTQFEKTTSKQVFYFIYFITLFLITQPNIYIFLFLRTKNYCLEFRIQT